jgi:hypothetical protein
MRKFSRRVTFVLFAAALLASASAERTAEAKGGASRRLGTVTGLVRDHRGVPLAGAVVRLIREGADTVSKQTSTSGDGTFTARVLPGKYLLTAIADGFNQVSFNSVQVNPSDEISYRFNLEPLGQGRTAPERRADRNDPKWRLRAAQGRRSIFQAGAGEDATVRAAESALEEAEAPEGADAEESQAPDPSSKAEGRLPVHGVVQTYTAFSEDARAGAYAGTNFAVSTAATDKLDLVFAGQFATNGLARFETTGGFRPAERHRMNLTLGGARVPTVAARTPAGGRALGQVSVRAVDEWVVRDGVVVVLGLDYSRLLGPRGGDASLSPRLGFQFEADPRTRFQVSYAPGLKSDGLQSVANFEGSTVVFRGAGEQPIAYVDGRAVLERTHRLEFGVERVIDNASSVEAAAFFDAVEGRGVGLLNVPLDGFANADGAQLLQVANQQGAARGLRVVYARRVGSRLKASAGYSFGRGQSLAPLGPGANPSELFRGSFFQTVAAQFDSSFDTGTRVRTVLRFSPRAAVFAIDPFAGRLAVYDPSLSILVTQDLPTFGLPVRAEAVVDARNLLDVLASADDGETLTSVGANRRTVRGGISVRF